MNKLILGISLLLISSPLQASNWIKVSTSSQGDVVFVDADSIKPYRSKIRAWEKWDYSANKKEPLRERKILVEYDCSVQTSATVSSISYRADGSVASSYSNNAYEIRHTPNAPDTVGYSLLDFVCTVSGKSI